MRSLAPGEIEHIHIRINSYLLQTGCESFLLSACLRWVLNYFKDQQWSTYCLSGIVLTSGGTKKKNRSPHGAYLQCGRLTGKRLLWERIAAGAENWRRESPVLWVKVWAGSWKTTSIYFCRERKWFPGEEWHVQNHGVTSPGNHEYIPIRDI